MPLSCADKVYENDKYIMNNEYHLKQNAVSFYTCEYYFVTSLQSLMPFNLVTLLAR